MVSILTHFLFLEKLDRGGGGGVISSILFTQYIDDLLYELEQSEVGCF